MKETLESAKIAANWWTEKIRGGAIHDNGANDDANVMGMLLANILGFKNAPSEDQLTRFNDILADLISEKLYSEPKSYVYLDCDYGPNYILSLAADTAGIDPIVFPFKTSVFVYKDKVIIRDGYGAPQKEIWKA